MREKEKPCLKSFMYDLARGSVVGSINVTIVAPVMNYTNHLVYARRLNTFHVPFDYKRAFDGVVSYNSSVIPMVATALLINDAFIRNDLNYSDDTSSNKKLCYSATSGLLSGAIGNAPEGVAQAQQLSRLKPNALTIVKKVRHYHGLLALNAGALATMIRQSKFTAGYMWAMPKLTKSIDKLINNSNASSAVAAILTGVPLGIITTPINNLRWHKQYYMHTFRPVPSYCDILNKGSHVNLMAGWRPRMLLTTVSMFVLDKGKQVYDNTRYLSKPQV